MYLLNFLFVLISGLVANAVLAINIPDENWNKLLNSAKLLCSCSNRTFDDSVKCDVTIPISALGSAHMPRVDDVCENMIKIAGIVSSIDMAKASDDKDKIETPAKGGDDKGKTETPAKGGDDKDKVETPAKGGDDKDKIETPAKGGDDKDKIETPTKGGDDKDKIETLAKASDDKDKIETPAKRGDDKDKIVIPAKGGDDKDKIETPAKGGDDKNDNKATNTDHLKTSSKKEGKMYSLPTLLAILFCSFGAGIIFAVAAKLAYDRYRKRSYVLPPEQGMQL